MKLTHSVSPSLKALVFMITTAFVVPLKAQQQWWFDVEVIVFKRLESAEDLDENFDSWKPINSESAIDLLTPYLFPDVEYVRNSLPLCYPPAEPMLSQEDLEQALIELENSSEILDQENGTSLPAEDGIIISDQSLYNDEPASIDATDNLFLQLEQEQRNSDEELLRYSLETTIADQALDDAFEALFLPVDHEVHWVDVEPLKSVACQFNAEMRYFDDLLTPYTLNPKVIDQTPRDVNPPYKNYTGQPYLLPKENFQLKTMARDLNRQQGVRIVSHMLWRQEVLFGRSKAPAFRLLAGMNYGNDYQITGDKYPFRQQLEETAESTGSQPLFNNEGDLITQISALIEGDSASKPIEQVLFESEMAVMQKSYPTQQERDDQGIEQAYYPPVWEVDGLFKVYLQLLGRTPYLHIDSQLNYRQPGKLPIDNGLSVFKEVNSSFEDDPEAFLHSYSFQQLRRIISKEIHYFDHPAFGLIVQLRRYHPPAVDEE